MIIIDRNTGEAVYSSTSEDIQKQMRMAVIRAHLGLHPEMLAEAVAKYQRETGIA